MMDYNQKYLKYKAKYFELKTHESNMNSTNEMTGGGEKCSNCGMFASNCKLSKCLKGGNKQNKKLYLFKADWCPHCKMFAETWKNLRNDLKGRVKFVTYDSEKHANKIKAFNVSGFPTLILRVNDKAIEYVGSRDIDSLKKFISKY